MSEKCIKVTERKNDTHAVNVPINRMSDSVNKCGKHLPKMKKIYICMFPVILLHVYMGVSCLSISGSIK